MIYLLKMSCQAKASSEMSPKFSFIITKFSFGIVQKILMFSCELTMYIQQSDTFSSQYLNMQAGRHTGPNGTCSLVWEDLQQLKLIKEWGILGGKVGADCQTYILPTQEMR